MRRLLTYPLTPINQARPKLVYLSILKKIPSGSVDRKDEDEN
jgi:hypothetical protein